MLSITRSHSINEALYQQLLALWDATGISNPARSDSLAAIAHSLEHTGTLILAHEDGELIGSIWLTHDYRRLYLHHMAVAPTLQNRGIGSKMLQEALQLATELGYQAKLEVHATNHPAMHLYKKHGFNELKGYLTCIKRDI